MKPENLKNSKSIGLLLDPDKASGKSLENLLSLAEKNRIDYILAGGSITFNRIDPLLSYVRERSSIPVILFPGNLLQLSLNADTILLLSLISGRNPELLIGNHVLAAPYLKDVRDKLLPAGYILINCGTRTSVEYMSQTEAIPSDKTDIIIATALAGEMLGLKLIYLEGGSGSLVPVPPEIIRAVKDNITIPLIVGGGMKTASQIEAAFISGADMVILGNGCEKNPDLITEACKTRDRLRLA
jgi:putative glycerol-1-phosphate prenyltransferase